MFGMSTPSRAPSGTFSFDFGNIPRTPLAMDVRTESPGLLENEDPPQSPLFAGISSEAFAQYDESMRRLRKSRRNTMHQMSPTQQPSTEFLGGEMPPPSPFFADVSSSEIAEVRESIRQAKISRRNTLTGQRSTWCAVDSVEPRSASTRRAAAASSSLARPSLTGMLGLWQPWDESPTKRGTSTRLFSDSEGTGDWIFNQEPPKSPLFAAYHSEKAEERRRTLADIPPLLPPPHNPSALIRAVEDAANDLVRPGEIGDLEDFDLQERWFQVDVHSLFQSPFSSGAEPKVTVREIIVHKDNGAMPLAAVDANDPDLLPALERYLSLLTLKSRSEQKPESVKAEAEEKGCKYMQRRPTRLRIPSRSRLPPDIIDFHTPALSFMVRSKGNSLGRDSGCGPPADRRVRAVDLEAMVEAYLPHVYAEMDPDATKPSSVRHDSGEFTRSPSESSIATLADPSSQPQPQSQSQQPPIQLRKPTDGDTKTFDPSSIPRRRSEVIPSSSMRDPLFAAAAHAQLNRQRSLRTSSSLNTAAASSVGGSSMGSRIVSPRSSVLSTTSSWASTDQSSAMQRRLSPKVGVRAASSSPTTFSSQQSSSRGGSLRSRKDMAPLSIAPVRRQQRDSATEKPSSGFGGYRGPASSGLRVSRAAPPIVSSRTAVVSAPGSRRRGVSTGAQMSASETPAATTRPRASFSGEEARPRALYSNYQRANTSATPSAPRVSAPMWRRPDAGRSFTEQNPSGRAERHRSSTGHTRAATNPQPQSSASERSAVRQRIGAKLNEYRSRLFSP
ncbi:hypothetical protein GGF46_001678 [Coemansia sp. RSA 552]|nr:hypothetical protein GGF46_001678 [Coemansia sp. RSA 552]